MRSCAFGFDLDRTGLERLCEGAVSAEEVAGPLLDRCDFQSDEEQTEGEWIWICVLSLWQRWWPEKVCLELLNDKIQSAPAARGAGGLRLPQLCGSLHGRTWSACARSRRSTRSRSSTTAFR